MAYEINQVARYYKGSFLTPPLELQQKLARVKAYIFDWDGVFNNGTKDEHGFSPFSEVDAMGTNILRFCHYLRFSSIPYVAVISGEKNKASSILAQRERFHAVYSGFKHKKEALDHLCKKNGIAPQEVAFVFDDLLDLSVAAVSGVKIMVGRKANPILTEFVIGRRMVDYVTACAGGDHAVRETTELLGLLTGKLTQAFTHRMEFSAVYRQYLAERDKVKPAFYLSKQPENNEDVIQ